MCGIIGLLDDRADQPTPPMVSLVTAMTAMLQHRGPDSDGIFVDAEAGIGLGHRRLAIIDLSPDGAQPMRSASGRYIVVFNGEIYNFRDLRRELEESGTRFRGHSDTEVLLAAIEHWGLARSLQRLVGMYAFGLWDRATRELHLVRDRLGKKPVYIARLGHQLLFASELKAFHAHPSFMPEIDRDALTLFLRHCYVPAPYSIYRDVIKLPPASHLSIPLAARPLPDAASLIKRVQPYWSAREVAERGVAAPLRVSEKEAVAQLAPLLEAAVGCRMIADVPLGAFLSGGIDSSAVVALMQTLSSRPVKTYSIGFREEAFDEAPDARRIAEHLGTDHTEFYVTAAESREVIPDLPEIYDEPFADASQIPTHLVAKMAREDVTVVLSGDGGDEVFGGYRRHVQAARLKCLHHLPTPLLRFSRAALTSLSPDTWDGLFAVFGRALPKRVRRSFCGDDVHKLAGLLPSSDPAALYFALTSCWPHPAMLVPGAAEPLTNLTRADVRPHLSNFAEQMIALDTVTYLPDDILTKVDRATMAVGLEARAPLLDHRVVEFAWRLPLELKVSGDHGKRVLRRLLAEHVPESLFERPKQGFALPIAAWLRGPLRVWAEDLLAEKRLLREGIFDPRPIQHCWREHLSGRCNWSHRLWNVLMFQAWHQHWSERRFIPRRSQPQQHRQLAFVH